MLEAAVERVRAVRELSLHPLHVAEPGAVGVLVEHSRRNQFGRADRGNRFSSHPLSLSLSQPEQKCPNHSDRQSRAEGALETSLSNSNSKLYVPPPFEPTRLYL